mmetsp:Transcript_120212/g.351305  ORF Transcript_120212/g.351305 Transcript_120212/m.351305 type:complete len:650 (+) Transcript_120212:70-2019(+)
MPHPRHTVTLRFRNRETERHFVKSQSEQLMRSFCRLAFLSATACAFMLPSWLATQGATAGDPRVIRTQQIAVTLDLAGMLLFSAAGIAANSPMIYRCVSPGAREVAVVFMLTLFTPLPFLISKFYCPTLLGYNPHVIWEDPHLSDTRPVLALALCMTGSHFTLPVRWVVLFPLEVFTVVVYAFFAFAVGGPDGAQAWSTLVLYGGLVLFSALGRRTIEHHQRDALAQLITERQLRAETEFRMAELEQSTPRSALRHTEEDQPASRQDQLSTRESRAETTPSAQAFVSASQGGDLRSVMEVGKHEQWLIDPEEINLIPQQVLGKGGFGTVVAGCYAGAPVAVKMVQFVSDQGREKREWQASNLNEIRILRRLRHPNVILFFGACHCSDDTVLLIMERVHGPCLERFILAGGVPDRPLRMTDLLKAVVDTCRAVCYLHTRQPSVVHGDLNGNNVVMERDPSQPDSFRAKLLDFGLACVLTRHVGHMGGTVMWIAPEVVQDPSLPAHSQADVFSFGRLSFFVITGVFPFGCCYNKERMLQTLTSGSLPPLPWPTVCSPLITEWCSWIEACSAYDPMRRPSMEYVRLRTSETLRNFGLDVATEAQGSAQAAQQEEADSGGAAAPPSGLDMPLESPEAPTVSQNSAGWAAILSL